MVVEGFQLAKLAIGGIVNYFSDSQEIKKAKEDGKIAVLKADANQKIAVSEAKIAMAKSEQTNNYDLDKIAMQNMKNSYKDEIVLFVFLAPMVASFFPDYAPQVKAGFDAISEMPDWYMYLIVGMVVVIYGMRGMLSKMVDGRYRLFSKDKPSGK